MIGRHVEPIMYAHPCILFRGKSEGISSSCLSVKVERDNYAKRDGGIINNNRWMDGWFAQLWAEFILLDYTTIRLLNAIELVNTILMALTIATTFE